MGGRPPEVVHQPGADGGILGGRERLEAAIHPGGLAGVTHRGEPRHAFDERSEPRGEGRSVEEHDLGAVPPHLVGDIHSVQMEPIHQHSTSRPTVTD